ncbi:response regulator transcription factor [Alkalihalobacillus sp. AL-G]|uniref:response regulator transcription factor n=1 Tax=Alkalihalobacillus sp. AL-G TaxID=2926399 RepID=UPI00272CA16B|nr:response regulator transcription factor [Alkalihalobacillus sp. AL-G]WLD92603.1 response regulator transcription factor [Alkalihalobacillus sp. AL-G]
MHIVIAEDQGMLRGAISRLLAMEDDIKIVGETDNGEEALQLIQKHKPDIALLDIEMPTLSGLEVAEKLKAAVSDCKVVIVTTFARSGYLQQAVKAGVQGYLLKDTPVSELAESLRKINAGRRVFSPHLTFSMMEETNPLTERESEILGRLKDGDSVKDISNKLFLSPGTVRNYISEVIQKLEAKNRIDAVTIAENKGWLKR